MRPSIPYKIKDKDQLSGLVIVGIQILNRASCVIRIFVIKDGVAIICHALL